VAERFVQDFKRFFLRGLAAGLPAVLTIALLVVFFAKVQQYVGQHINVAVQWVIVQLSSFVSHLPFQWQGDGDKWDTVRDFWNTYHFGWVGFLLAFVAIYIFGRFVASMIGRYVWQTIERATSRLPVVKQIYPAVKQVTDYLLSPKHKGQFSRVVAVEYPRRGCWSLGLVTGAGIRTVHQEAGGDMLTIFVPSSPTPFTGYTVIVRRSEVLDLPISIDEALRFIMSGGVILPVKEQLSSDEIRQATRGVFPEIGDPNSKENAE
jgi:uncharacterized membrane protein